MSFHQDNNILEWEGEGERIRVEAYGMNCIRFRASHTLEIQSENWTLLPAEPAVSCIDRTENGMQLTCGNIRCHISENGIVTYEDATGRSLLREYAKDRRTSLPPIRSSREYRSAGGDLFHTWLYFEPDDQEHFYGMGQHADNCFDLKGCTLELAQKNTQTNIPFVLSSKGYGFVWNNPAVGRAEFVKNHTLWEAQATAQIDYLVFVGNTPAQINEILCRLYGKAPMMPDWVMGYWQCKLRYVTQEELLEAAREHVQRRGLPMDVIVCDFYHWSQHGDWKFNPDYWPDPEAMVQELESMGVHLAVSIWPTVDMRSENYAYMRNNNMLMRTERNAQVVKMSNGPLIYFDATNPKARDFVWSRVKENYYDQGVRIFWLDESEPGMLPYDYDNVRFHRGPGLAVSNLYPFCYARGFYEGQRAAGQTEICNLIRSMWLGAQRYGAILWSGDIPSTFDSLRRQVKVGLSVSLCGVPWWTTDIGGFFDGDARNPEFVELLIRWFQFGCFSPVFRMHGNRWPYSSRPHGMADFTPTSGENQVWSFGEEALAIMTRYLKLRESMRPYLKNAMREASEKGTPVMRPLLYEFPDDPAAWRNEDAYMFGSSMLIAPVMEYGARSRKVYLPEGAIWTEMETGKVFDGGQTVTAQAPLAVIPVFLRDGFELDDSCKGV